MYIVIHLYRETDHTISVLLVRVHHGADGFKVFRAHSCAIRE